MPGVPASRIAQTDIRGIQNLVTRYTKPGTKRTPSIFPIPKLRWGKELAGETGQWNRRAWAVHKVRKDMPVKLLGGQLALDERRRLPMLQKVQMRASDQKRFDRFGGVEGVLAATDGKKLTRWGRHLRATLFNELHRIPHRRFIVEHPELHHLEYLKGRPRGRPSSSAQSPLRIQGPTAGGAGGAAASRGASHGSSTEIALARSPIPNKKTPEYESTYEEAYMDRRDTDEDAANMRQDVWDYKYIHRPELQRADNRQADLTYTVEQLMGQRMPSGLNRKTIPTSTALPRWAKTSLR